MKPLKMAYAAAVLVAVVFIAWIAGCFPSENTRLKSDDLTVLAMDAQPGADGLMTQTAQLGPAFRLQQSVAFFTNHRGVRVYLNDECIYEFGFMSGAPEFVRSRGSLWHVVALPPGSDGSALRVELYAAYDNFDGVGVDVYSGPSANVKFNILWSMLPTIVCNSIVLFLGVAAILLHLFIWLRRISYGGGFLYVGLLAISVGFWVLCQNGVLQLIFPSAQVSYFFDFFVFFLFPVPFNLFLYSRCVDRKRWMALAQCWVYVACLAINVVCQLAGWVDMYDLLPMTHGVMLVNALLAAYLIWYETARRHNRNMRQFILPLLLALVCGLLEMWSFYRSNSTHTTYFLQVGVVVYLSAMMMIVINQYFEDLTERQKLAYYEKLANVDLLTEAQNRNAYESVLNDPASSAGIHAVVMFDINNLKAINDGYGHELGDEAIKACHRCICESFRGMGNCYRIGGDEFVFFMQRTEDMGRCIRSFEASIREAGAELGFSMDVAFGWALCDHSQPDALQRAVRNSDERMYENKLKKKRGPQAGC